MGSLAQFDVAGLVDRWGLRYFAETGTGRGDSLAYAAQFRFEGLWSCEMEFSLYRESVYRFKDNDRVRISSDRSDAFVRWLCRALPEETPILFWLDAHFPGADYTDRSYGDEVIDRVRLPLQAELEAISLFRPQARDVVLVDDLRIYLDGPFEHGNLPPDVRPHCPRDRNIDFIHDLMGPTHDIALSYSSEGYIVMTPKEST